MIRCTLMLRSARRPARPAHGHAEVGLSLAFAGLAVFALAAVLGFSNANAGETLHPISVPLTGIGMLLTAVATIRTRHWNGWQRLAPLLCGIVPFAVELPGFITFGDSAALYYFIALWAFAKRAALGQDIVKLSVRGLTSYVPAGRVSA
jgi:hypothetical protein